MRLALAVTSILLALGTLACRGPEQASAEQPVDSVVPRAVALQRFQATEGAVTALTGGAVSRDELVQLFAEAVVRRDTAALRALTLTRAEYAWLYYPTTPQGLPPYDLSPDLLWFLIEGRGRQGLGNLLLERGGQGFRYGGYGCLLPASVEGENLVHGPCFVRRLESPRDTLTERLFGPIIERGGRFKFVNLANDF